MASLEHVDGDLLRDFLTESAELIDRLDQDLVALESNPDGAELMNSIFRSIHTIKGSGGMIGLDAIVGFAHAAEDALNFLRRGEAKVTQRVMDLLLAATDVTKRQLAEVREARMPEEGPADLMAALRGIRGEGTTAPPEKPASNIGASSPDIRPLDLADSKRELIPFIVDDLNQTIDRLTELIEGEKTGSNLAATAADLQCLTDEMARAVEFFEIEALTTDVHALRNFARGFPALQGASKALAGTCVHDILEVLRRRAKFLAEAKHFDVSTTAVRGALERALKGNDASAGSPPIPFEVSPPGGDPVGAKPAGGEQVKHPLDQTVRVDVSRLESLLNLMGELVLQKNRVLGLWRRMKDIPLDQSTREAFGQVASDLDRVTAELQTGVMKTRLQPLGKLFSRYPRFVRDLARAAGKEIEIEIAGGETEVDKSVLEALGDPLVHILRNSADHGIEKPCERTAQGKRPRGTISMTAHHEGNRVVVVIKDDGKGIDPVEVGRKAVERGLVTPEVLAGMSEEEIIHFIFLPGFSTVEVVSNLSGRGVGMDVVRTNLDRINGTVDVASRVGEGTTVSLKIPLTVAIMPAMMVGVGTEHYVVPLASIQEIVKPEGVQAGTIRGRRVLRLRESILPLLDLADHFGCRSEEAEAPYALVVGVDSEKRIGLLVSRLIGRHEVVIKSLDEIFDRTNSISGATVREDGTVSLIIDVAALMKSMKQDTANAN